MPLLRPALRRALTLRGCLVLVSLAVLGTLGVVTAPGASAHPFGDPQTLEVEDDGATVRLRWRVGGTDDLTALAQHLGLLPAERVLLDGAVLSEDGDAALLAGSSALADYLLDRLRVSADGAPCPGELLPVADLAGDGAVLAFDCGPADEVEVEARTLTDLHPEYRTLATGPGGQRAAYDDEHPRHTWSLAAVPEGSGGVARSAVVQLGSVLGAAALLGVAGALYLRRRGRGEVADA